MKRTIKRKVNQLVTAGCVFTLALGSITGCRKEDTKNSDEAKGPKIYTDASKPVEDRVKDLLGRMTIEQKIAQMIMAERNVEGGGAAPEDVKKYGLGAVLSGGGSAPTTGNNPEDWSEHLNSYKVAATESELGIPLIYGVDSVHGNSNVYGTTIFPHQIGLGATGDAELVKTIGGIVAQETVAVGANYAFSPVLGVPENERWGRFYECFGENVDLVTELGTAYIQGYQGVLGSDEFLSNSKVLASAKHYIGEGQTDNGINQGMVNMTADEWED
ncbi:MAG: beta-glucosidase, partial [Lachnospiraceae bacterium]|nr:beta-glucosidase [Lachnospiraceae bacterium]